MKLLVDDVRTPPDDNVGVQNMSAIMQKMDGRE